MEHEVICMRNRTGGCGFRVHSRYFETKRRFTPGICPNCGGPVAVVQVGTDEVVPTLEVARPTGEIRTKAE